MKTFSGSSFRLILCLAAGADFGVHAQTITFTTDTTIGIIDTNYDGADIVVTNCTLTVDGAHSFARLQILNGGTLTHTFSPNGLLDNISIVLGEQHVLSGTVPVTLNFSNAVYSTVVVRDLSGSVTYTYAVDYVVLGVNNLITIARAPVSAIPDGATVRVDYQVNNRVQTGLNLVVAGDMIVAGGGSVNANSRGYFGGGPGVGQRTGSPVSGGGGGHGGY